MMHKYRMAVLGPYHYISCGPLWQRRSGTRGCMIHRCPASHAELSHAHQHRLAPCVGLGLHSERRVLASTQLANHEHAAEGAERTGLICAEREPHAQRACLAPHATCR